MFSRNGDCARATVGDLTDASAASVVGRYLIAFTYSLDGADEYLARCKVLLDITRSIIILLGCSSHTHRLHRHFDRDRE